MGSRPPKTDLLRNEFGLGQFGRAANDRRLVPDEGLLDGFHD